MDPVILNIRKRLQRWELDHLRALAAAQSEEIDTLRAEVERLKREVDYERDAADNAWRMVDVYREIADSPDDLKPAITIDGEVFATRGAPA